MEIRHALHPEQAKQLDTERLRENFLIRELFVPGQTRLVYSYYDRLIVGGIQPAGPLQLEVDESIIGSANLLDRREMGIINIGAPGSLTVDGEKFAMDRRDGLYIGMGGRDVAMASDDPADPARFYIVSAPAHREYPTTHVAFADAAPTTLGEDVNSNKRTIRKYFHPDGVQSCQLVMGMTTLEPGSIWNTMPPHSHQRRMEAYLYFDIAPDQVVFHFMGQADETRHLVVRESQAVLSPSWSLHAGAGTGAYTFIWGMAGENQAFTDMDHIAMDDLK